MSTTNSFIADRVFHASQKVMHSQEYKTKNEECLLCSRKLSEQLANEETRRLFDVYSDSKNALSCLTDEACYLQGFQDMIRLMAGLPLE